MVKKEKKDYNETMRILIVEDDRKVARFLQRGLEEEHYAVDVCRNGNDALYHAQINEYDVIILDIMLPGRDGITVCRDLRGKGIITPILMLTARDSVEDKVSGLTDQLLGFVSVLNGKDMKDSCEIAEEKALE